MPPRSVDATQPAPSLQPAAPEPHLPKLSRWVGLVALIQFATLVAGSGGYGYHRDEMYFIVSGQHLAWGYPDQPSLTPLLARLMNSIDPGSPVVLRLPSSMITAGVSVVAALIARELGSGARAQVIAAVCTSTCGFAVAVGHIVSTTTFDLASTTVLLWLLIRAVQHRSGPALLLAGVVAGIGSEAKPQVALVAVVALAVLVVVGPREALQPRWLAGGVVAAVVLAAPYVIWQSTHGWPQLAVAGNVAGSAEGGRIGFIPFQLVLASPVYVPIWGAGLLAPWRRRDLRAARFLPIAYVVLGALYLVGNGKAYYLASLYPALLGLGAIPTAHWTRRAHARLRTSLVVAAVVGSAAIAIVIALPVVPTTSLQGSATMALNPDAGETVGWPRFTDTVAVAWDSIPAAERQHTVIFTANYGEAGDIDLFGGSHGLPGAYSGQNAFSEWGPPPDSATHVLLVGYDGARDAAPDFVGCSSRAVVNDGVGLDNDEQGLPVLFCRVSHPWSALWHGLRHYD